jgi:hypothetical protein
MIGPFHVEWWPRALDDWERLPFDDAVAVARGVRAFAETGAGLMIYTEGEYRLFVGAHVVVLLIDGDTLHVDRVRRA